MNARPLTRFRDVLDQIATTATWVLVGFCVIEVLLTRAGRAAAGLLMRVDSDLLRWIESAGATVRPYAANGVLYGACAVVAAILIRDARRVSLPGKGALVAAMIGCVGIAARFFLDRNSRELWLIDGACAVLASIALIAASRRAEHVLAALLELGIAAHALWVVLVIEGLGAKAWLDRGSEVLVFGGAAGAAFASAFRESRPRTRAFVGLAVAALLFTLAMFFREGSSHVARHLTGLAGSGLPFVASAALGAAAVGGIVALPVRSPLLAPLLVAIVCARRPEPHLVAGVLAAAGLLVVFFTTEYTENHGEKHGEEGFGKKD